MALLESPLFGKGGAGDELAFKRVVRCRVGDAEDEVPDLGREFGRERPPRAPTYFFVRLCREWRTELRLEQTTNSGRTAKRVVV